MTGSPPNFVGTLIHTSLFKVNTCVGIKGPRRVPRLPNHPQLLSKLEASMGYRRPASKKPKPKPNPINQTEPSRMITSI